MPFLYFLFISCFYIYISFFSFIYISLSIVSTVCAVHCFHLSRCPGVYVAMCSHCFVFSLSCVSVGCVSCHDPVLVCVLCVVIPWRVLCVCCMLLCCVQGVVLLLYVRVCSV